MGQYYGIAIKYLDETTYNQRKVKGEDYIMAKLMEHSYFGNHIMDSVAKILEDYEAKLAWIGDYAEQGEVDEITKGEADYDDLWGEDEVTHEFDSCKFDYKGKFLVNKDKKLYISFDEYLGKIHDEWAINPISILTAIGNGRGGGDYCGNNMALVGSWAWDTITIADKAGLEANFADCERFDITFVEGEECDGEVPEKLPNDEEK